MKSYREQQRERLSDAVFDYLSDGNTTAEELIYDFYAEVKSAFDYFDKYAKKCEKVMNSFPKSEKMFPKEKSPQDTMRVNYPEAGSEEWEKFWSEFDE